MLAHTFLSCFPVTEHPSNSERAAFLSYSVRFTIPYFLGHLTPTDQAVSTPPVERSHDTRSTSGSSPIKYMPEECSCGLLCHFRGQRGSDGLRCSSVIFLLSLCKEAGNRLRYRVTRLCLAAWDCRLLSSTFAYQM